MTHDRRHWSRLKGGLLALVALSCAPGLGRLGSPPEWDTMIASEEAILQVTPEIKRLNQSVLNLQLPDESTRGLFGDFVEDLDLASVDLAVQGPLGTVGLASVEDVASLGNT